MKQSQRPSPKTKAIRLACALSAPVILASAGAAAAPNCAPLLEQGCVCGLAMPATLASPVGQLTDIVGGVLVSGPQGFVRTAPAMPIAVGDSIIVPSAAEALFTSNDGVCRQPLPAETNLVIRGLGECACASLVSVDVETTTGQTGVETAVGAAILTGGGITTYLVVDSINDANDNDDDPVSP